MDPSPRTRRYLIRRTLAVLYAALLITPVVAGIANGEAVSHDFSDWFENLLGVTATVAIFAYVIGFRPRRQALWWNLLPWAALALAVYGGYEATLVNPATPDDVAQAAVILAGTFFFYPLIHLLFRFRAIGRLPETADAQRPTGWKRLLGFRRERDVWTDAVPHPRWIQFGFRAPLVIVTLWCVWLGIKIEQKHAQHVAIGELKERGEEVSLHRVTKFEKAFEGLISLELLEDVVRADLYTGKPCSEQLIRCQCLETIALHSGAAQWRDGDVRPLAQLRQLRQLWLEDVAISDETLLQLARLDHLESLSISSDALTDESIVAIAQRPLTVLSVSSSQLTDASAEALGRCHTLLALSVFKARFTDEGLQHLCEIPYLELLTLEDVKIAGEGFRALRKQVKLTDLTVKRTNISDGAIAHLGGLKSLENLALTDAPITGVGLRKLAGRKALRTLDLSATRISDDGLDALSDLPRLKALTLRNTEVTGRGFAHITNMPPIVDLDLSNCPIDDEGFAAIVTSLQVPCILDVSGTKITDEGLLKCPASGNLYKLSLTDTAVTDAGVAALGNFKGLTHLYLDRTKITPACIPSLARLPSLAWLSIGDTPLESEYGAAKLNEELQVNVVQLIEH